MVMQRKSIAVVVRQQIPILQILIIDMIQKMAEMGLNIRKFHHGLQLDRQQQWQPYQ